MEPPIVRHFLVCLGMHYDWSEPDAPYSLQNVVFRISTSGQSYPLVVPDLWLFVRMDGVGEHECWVEVHQVSEPHLSEEEEWETLTAVYGPFVASFGTTPQSLSRGWHIRGVPFPAPGWYEFQLMTKGVVLAQEPVYLED